MSKFIISGPQKLHGEITVAGAKNAALKAIPAAFLMPGKVELRNMPQIQDVEVMLQIAQDLGAQVQCQGDQVSLDTVKAKSSHISAALSGKARTSIMLVGPLLLRGGEVTIGHPGGCAIGRRPIDQFLEGFRAFGIAVKDEGDQYRFSAEKLRAATYFFPFVSVTVTETLMMTATLIPGTTILKNSAGEPEVQALADYLNKCGAKISGAGTRTIHIEGVRQLRPTVEYAMIPDRLETGMFAILAAATGSDLMIRRANPEHVESLLAIFDNMGVKYERGQDWLRVIGSDATRYRCPGKIITHEYPGFATDLQPPLTVFLTQITGTTLVHETIFEGRLFYIDLLNRMGANIILCDPHRALVQGPTPLRGKTIESPDIRAGIAIVIAALVAQGETVIDNIYQIERGFERLEERFRAIGAKIERLP